VKRFWREVQVAKLDDGRVTVALDGKPIRTPARRVLSLPNRALGEAIAEEWSAQRDEVVPATMPLTRLVSTAIDRVSEARASVVAEIAGYGDCDLLCYRASSPPELVARQAEVWQPLLDWAQLRFEGALRVTNGLGPLSQPPASLAAIRAAVGDYDAWMLTGLHVATTVTGSVIVGLALAEGHLDADAAWAAGQLDETFQIERWGEDAEATIRRAAQRSEIADAARLMALARA
jgi:chaperone required for assembly of F1-ATPase